MLGDLLVDAWAGALVAMKVGTTADSKGMPKAFASAAPTAETWAWTVGKKLASIRVEAMDKTWGQSSAGMKVDWMAAK